MTASLFACNYELKIIASEDVIFDSPQINAEPCNVEQGEGHIDAAYGGEDSMEQHFRRFRRLRRISRRNKTISLFYWKLVSEMVQADTLPGFNAR